MTIKVLPKAGLPKLVEKWMEHTTVHAPVRQGDFVQFQPLASPDQMALDAATNTRYPPKSLLLPQSEAMFRVRGGKLASTEDEVAPTVVLGIRPCDTRALQLLDTIFLTEEDEDPYWARKRQQTTIVAIGCSDPCETCFCSTVGTGPFDSRGVDALLGAFRRAGRRL